jgi:hypothetical protein
LLPLPIKILNYDNENNNNDQVLHKRFFLIDSSASDGTIVRYAKSLTLIYEIVENTKLKDNSGIIYPPLLIIDYDYVRLTQSNLISSIQIMYDTIYRMNFKNQGILMYAAFGSLAGISFFYCLIRTWNWNKRSVIINSNKRFIIIKIICIYSYLNIQGKAFV